MPGVHGGGEPAKAFAAMTDFHYLTLARAEFLAKQEPRDEWSEFRKIAPPEPLRSALVFGAMLAMCVLLARKPQRSADPAAPSLEDAKSAGPLPAHAEPAATPEGPSSPPPAGEANVVDGPWGRRSKPDRSALCNA
jgi:hypothetical protein